ncbi:hypothetical protein [Arthrobacter methylotrophus]|uniref:hypothetical protein n=1 Tax=Arthrobacter methylotrophus TaxID=121291 RepID=UPI0031E5CB83
MTAGSGGDSDRASEEVHVIQLDAGSLAQPQPGKCAQRNERPEPLWGSVQYLRDISRRRNCHGRLGFPDAGQSDAGMAGRSLPLPGHRDPVQR